MMQALEQKVQKFAAQLGQNQCLFDEWKSEIVRVMLID